MARDKTLHGIVGDNERDYRDFKRKVLARLGSLGGSSSPFPSTADASVMLLGYNYIGTVLPDATTFPHAKHLNAVYLEEYNPIDFSLLSTKPPNLGIDYTLDNATAGLYPSEPGIWFVDAWVRLPALGTDVWQVGDQVRMTIADNGVGEVRGTPWTFTSISHWDPYVEISVSSIFHQTGDPDHLVGQINPALVSVTVTGGTISHNIQFRTTITRLA